MKYYLILSTILATGLFAQDDGWVHPETGWTYGQSTLEAFYYLADLTIDGVSAEGDGLGGPDAIWNNGGGECYNNSPDSMCDVIGAFNINGDCVGWAYGGFIGGVMTVPVSGNDGMVSNFMNMGEIPTLKVYDASNGSILDVTPGSALPGWAMFGQFQITGTSTANNTFGCTDESACNYNADATADDESCAVNDCAGDCGGAAEVDECGVCNGDNSSCADCAGTPNGDAVEDECGVCNGDGIAEGTCDCDGNVELGCGCGNAGPSGCDNACGSTLEIDECGVCGGDNSSCEDCAGVPNGSAYVDACGNCGGTCGTWCDICDVCEGDGSSCAEPSWRIQLVAEIDSYDQFQFSGNADWLLRDDQNFLGAAGNATWGYDSHHDAPEPPTGPGNFIQLFFDHPEWDEWVTHYTEDIVDDDHDFFSNNLTQWDVRVESDVPGSTVITFIDEEATFGSIPSNYQIYAECNSCTDVWTDLRTDNTIDFYMDGSGQKEFSIYIGNIPPQAPDNLVADPHKKDIDIAWEADGDDLNDIGNRYPALTYNVYRDDQPRDINSSDSGGEFFEVSGDGPGGCGGLLTGDGQEEVEYSDDADLYADFPGEGLLQESTYTYTVTGSNDAGESSEGHIVRLSGGADTFHDGRLSEVTAETSANDDPTSEPSYTESNNGVNHCGDTPQGCGDDDWHWDGDGQYRDGTYEIPHNNDPDANRIQIVIDAQNSSDTDFPMENLQYFDYEWSLIDGDFAELTNVSPLNMDKVWFSVGNAHSDSQEPYNAGEHNEANTYTWNLEAESRHPIKKDGACGVWNYELHSHYDNQDITITIRPEPNQDPIAADARDLIRGGDGFSVLTSDDYDDQGQGGSNDYNDFDSGEGVWYEPHNNHIDDNKADLFFTGYNSDDADGHCDAGGPPTCVYDCDGFFDLMDLDGEPVDSTVTINEICQFVVDICDADADGSCITAGSCLADCDDNMLSDIEGFNGECYECLNDGVDGSCEELEGCEDGFVEDCSGDGDCVPEEWIGDTWCDGADQPYGADLTCYGADGSYCAEGDVSCGDGGDCDPNANSCGSGYVEDCSDADCCPESWIGDGVCDGEEQFWDCDLSCHDEDGGDCAEPETCADTNCGFFLNEGYICFEILDAGIDCSLCESEGVDCSEPEGCTDSQFDCFGDGSECIPGSYYCDGSSEFCNADWGADCSNGADEGLDTCGYTDDCAAGDDGGDGGGAEACSGCEYDFTAYGSECCDTAWDEYGIDCATLESGYSWDCSGCTCPGDDSTGGGDDGGGGCADGTIEDCSGDGDCAPDSWIGDGWCDGTDQPYGYDLTCYDNDGGDCGDTGRSDGLNRIEEKESPRSYQASQQAYLDKRIVLFESGKESPEKHGEVIANRSTADECDEQRYNWYLTPASLAGFDFSDADGDGEFDIGESFTLQNNDGIFSFQREDFIDMNNNGQWDGGENYNDSNGNGYYDIGTDLGKFIPSSTTEYGECDNCPGGQYTSPIDNLSEGMYGHHGMDLHTELNDDIYVLSMKVTDVYGDSDISSLLFIVKDERNEGPSVGSHRGQGRDGLGIYYMRTDENTRDVYIGDQETDYDDCDNLWANDSDNDTQIYTWTYSGAGAFDSDNNPLVISSFNSVYDHDNTTTVRDNHGWNDVEAWLVEGEHTFTFKTVDPYGESDSSSTTFLIANEPGAPQPSINIDHTGLRYVVISVWDNAWQDSSFVDDACHGDVWHGTENYPLYNTSRINLYNGSNEIATWTDVEHGESNIWTHVDESLDDETNYSYTVKAWNSELESQTDAVLESSDSTKTHDRPDILVLSPNGAEIRSVNDENTDYGDINDDFNVDFVTYFDENDNGEYDVGEETNGQYISHIDVSYLQDGSTPTAGENSIGALVSTHNGANDQGTGCSNPNGLGDSSSDEAADLSDCHKGDTTLQYFIADNDKNGVDINYNAKVRVCVTDVGDYNGNGQETYCDESDNPFTMASHTISKSYSAGWHLIGPPLTPNDSVLVDNFTESFETWGAEWVAYNVDGAYDGLSLNLGEGYYVALAGDELLTQKGDPVIGDPNCESAQQGGVCDDDSFAISNISLDKGWNLIANPLVNKVSKSTFTINDGNGDLLFEDAVDAGWIAPTIYGWFENAYSAVDRLLPFDGYFVNTSRPLTLQIRPHLFDDGELTRKAEEVVATSTLDLKARDVSGEGMSDFITVGLLENADNEFVYGEDEYDLPRQAYTSMGGEYIDMKIGNDLMKDIKSTEYEHFQVWNISIVTEKVDNDIELSWGDVNGFDDDLHIVINGDAIDMHEEASIEFSTVIDEIAIVVGNVDAYLNPVPNEFGLSAAYPNPFNPTTTLGLALNEDGMVSMSVYNIRGQVVEVLVDHNMKAGYHNVVWNADGISSGMYFVRVETGANTAIQKLMLLK